MSAEAHAIDTPLVQGRAHHHDPAENQAVGFWLYILSDVILFSALFATYVVQMWAYAGGPAGRELFDLGYVAIETPLLHMARSSSQRWNMMTFAFTALVMGIFIGGSMWIMFDLHVRMMG